MHRVVIVRSSRSSHDDSRACRRIVRAPDAPSVACPLLPQLPSTHGRGDTTMRTNGQSTRDASVYPDHPVAHRTHTEPSASDAVERVIDAGQRLVTERIELAKLDA